MPIARCHSCRYYGCNTDTCDFCYISGQRRGCPVSACTRYTPGQHCFLLPPELKQQSRMALMQSMYMLGLTDMAISRVLGLNHTTVLRWRHREGLAPQQDRRRQNVLIP